MNGTNEKIEDKNRRKLGIHLTSSKIFKEYIFSEISNKLNDYLWTDLYCGEGNLIFPILDRVPENNRIEFFKEHVFLSDIQEDMIQKCKTKAISYGIPDKVIEKNILLSDNLEEFPRSLLEKNYPIYHITNPPYLYLGYIRKNQNTQSHLKYFTEENDGYQDLYQIAMMNDLRNGIKNLIYIIPTNFLFGASISNKFRNDFFRYYEIEKTIIFETKVFEYTGTNIMIGVFTRKQNPTVSSIKFSGSKIKNSGKITRFYNLDPEYNFRAGTKFFQFVKNLRLNRPLNVKYYLKLSEIEQNKGKKKLEVINSSEYHSGKYLKKQININEDLWNKIKSNILFVKTVDSGSYDGRAGLYKIKNIFNVDGILVSKNTYRTSPIHLFLQPTLSLGDQELLMEYFNFILEYFRNMLDSEFLTTYKYSNADYTRKYLGLRQVRKIIKTFPLLEISDEDKEFLKDRLLNKDFSQIKWILEKY